MDRSETHAQESPWQKLRQRKVVHWSLGYVAVAWAMVQVLDFAVETFAWPSVLTRAGAVLALFGLPVTITLAWFHGERGEQRFTRAELALLALLVLGGGVALRQVIVTPAPVPASAATVAAPAETPVAAPDRHRLAILPFANFGDDPANAAFVSGVHDTLLTQVAKVPGLSVISRSSVLQFAGRQPTIGEVAAALGVGAVIEGSVARSGQRLRIQVQLIDAARDEHLWAETYDRDADDLFAVQSEIAQSVAAQLRIRLSNSETERLHALATRSPRAYEHYVLGRSHLPSWRLREAISEFAQAVTLDPEFAVAHAELSMAHTWLAFEEPGERSTSIPLARGAAERALALDPTLPEAHLALAVFLYRGEPDIERAAAEFERAIAGMPNDAAAHLNFAFLRRWQGRWEESAALFLRAAELDPRGVAPRNAIHALAGQGRRAEADRLILAAQAANPDDVWRFMLSGELANGRDCDLASYERVLQQTERRFADHPDVLHERWFFAWQRGDGRAALAFAEQLAEMPDADPERTRWRLGVARMLTGDRAEAERQMHTLIERQETKVAASPAGDQRASELSWLALQHSLLQEHAPAVLQAHRALAELPPGGAMMQRTDILLLVAVALARAGALEEALPLFRQSLAAPYPRTARGLWCDPLLASLRGEAAVRELMAELGADLSIDPARRETWPKPQSGG